MLTRCVRSGRMFEREKGEPHVHPEVLEEIRAGKEVPAAGETPAERKRAKTRRKRPTT